jgi:hypothetical protein
MRVWSYGPGMGDDPGDGVHEGMAGAAENPDRSEQPQTIGLAGQATLVRVQCDCGGQLGSVSLPSEEQSFEAVCPVCATRYRRSLAELFSHAEGGGDVLVTLPRARPLG